MLVFKVTFWFIVAILLFDVILSHSVFMAIGNIVALLVNIGVLRSLYFKPNPVDGSSLLAKKINR